MVSKAVGSLSAPRQMPSFELFCGNDASAYRAAIVYFLIGTCKNAGIEPRVWMEDVIKQIPYYLSGGRDLAELLPGAWASRNQL